MKIQAVCRKTGLSDRAIRFYMENKLINPDSTENYSGRRSFEFSDADVTKLSQVATLRKAGFSIEEIKELFSRPEAAGDVVGRRLKAVKRDAEKNAELLRVFDALGEKAIAARELTEALNTPMKEEKIPEKETEPPYVKMLRNAKRIIAALCILFLVPFLSYFLFAVSANRDYFTRYLQNGYLQLKNGYTVVTVDRDGVILSADTYALLAEVNGEDAKAVGKGDEYSFKSDYGEIKGTVKTSDGLTVEYGFINSNNWHNVRIYLTIVITNDTVTVRQIIFETRGSAPAVNESAAAAGERFISVYRGGLL